MLIGNRGITRSNFHIPPFDLKQGEIVVIHLFNGVHFAETEMLLKDIFTGKVREENVVVHKKLTFVEHYKEPAYRRLFYPVTVKEYLKENADLSSPFATKIYENKWIKENTKINTLPWTPRRLLNLYAILSKTKDILFDLVGQDPIGAETTYKVVKEVVAEGGSAILLDYSDDMKNDCNQYIELQWRD